MLVEISFQFHRESIQTLREIIGIHRQLFENKEWICSNQQKIIKNKHQTSDVLCIAKTTAAVAAVEMKHLQQLKNWYVSIKWSVEQTNKERFEKGCCLQIAQFKSLFSLS